MKRLDSHQRYTYRSKRGSDRKCNGCACAAWQPSLRCRVYTFNFRYNAGTYQYFTYYSVVGHSRGGKLAALMLTDVWDNIISSAGFKPFQVTQTLMLDPVDSTRDPGSAVEALEGLGLTAARIMARATVLPSLSIALSFLPSALLYILR
eukprot:scaffold94618_cov34-Prasinocladus_malaysianus.AAC.2